MMKVVSGKAKNNNLVGKLFDTQDEFIDSTQTPMATITKADDFSIFVVPNIKVDESNKGRATK